MNNLDLRAHLDMGNVLKCLNNPNILILGSDFSFHNMNYFHNQNSEINQKNNLFQDWLINTCALENKKAEEQLLEWFNAPFARFCHPREEHLIPILVCQVAESKPARLIFDNNILDKRAVAFLWE